MTKEMILITGASAGIGATYADRFAKRGHDLILVARDKARMEALAARLIEENGISVEVLQADLSDAADLGHVERRLREDGGITMLVNNAGMAGGGPAATADPDRLETLIRLNVLAFTRLAAAAASGFAARGRGAIVNIGSVTALFADQFEPTYPATKAFVLAFSQALHSELQPQGVRVQVVLPGATRTEIWERSGHSLDDLPAEIVMDVHEMVDAALAGLDMGEVVTIPALPDIADWRQLEDARRKLVPNLSLRHSAARYGVAPALVD
ncbi:SDR family oxidoreductase [Sphingomonas oleivorans]|uniref:SDR family oxidoreductase n=1 Tax=Sphingomonas oleivorans TaxID=1735121 RepID=A0A2T5G225_9SPHN|nr:SDR family oxidoreductase [Sphingomonas oleivorans]PTQ13161.1 SDR family oxidoreductase [Sphingomonas oleivorans]